MAVRGKHTAMRHRLRARILHLWDCTAVRQSLRARLPQLCVRTAVLYRHTTVSESLRAWLTNHITLYRP